MVVLLIVAAACTQPVGSPVTVPSGYQVVEFADAAFAVPSNWMVPEVGGDSAVVAVAAGDYQDGIPHHVQLRLYEEVESIADLQVTFAQEASMGEAVQGQPVSTSVPNAVEAARLSSNYSRPMPSPVGDPPLHWVSDHLLTVADGNRGYVLTVNTEKRRDDPRLRTQILTSFHLK